MTRKHRIVNKRRFTIFVVVMLILLTNVINFGLGLNTANSLTRTGYIDVEVAAGDTLWSIAQTYMPQEADVRAAVYQLCQANEISAADLQAGMTIQVPVSSL